MGMESYVIGTWRTSSSWERCDLFSPYVDQSRIRNWFKFFLGSSHAADAAAAPFARKYLKERESFRVQPQRPVKEFIDAFGNRCGRVFVPAGSVSFFSDAVVEDNGERYRQVPAAKQHDVQDLPNDTLQFLLGSRYCEVDSELNDFAWNRFGDTAPGWERVQAICDFVHSHIRFDYLKARRNRTAKEAFSEGVGVCRDFTHLAIALCRCMNVPARYATGYLGDIGIPPAPFPMDFSAWFEVYLSGQWHVFDARHNEPRIGRVLMARGRDAADVALTTAFGRNELTTFKVWTDEVRPQHKSSVLAGTNNSRRRVATRSPQCASLR